MSLLELRSVTKRFGGLVAVDDVTLDVEQGEIVGLIGPNGAGKTTLFNAVNGISPPTEGDVFFDGERISGMPSYEIARRGISKTHQIPKPLSDLTVLENATVGAAFGRANASLRDARDVAAEALEFTGLGDDKQTLARRLNAVQKKQLELARALAAQPMLILLDENAAGLNQSEVAGLLDTLREIRARGESIVMVEHIMEAVMGVSDRIVVLEQGRKLAEGTPQEIVNDERVIKAYLGESAEDDDATA